LLAAFAAYTIEKKTKLRPGEVPFGQGNIRGVAAPESANNAGSQTSFIPLLTLGIPPNAVMAFTNLLHSFAHIGYSTQCRDGLDGGCHDHSQHSAWSPSDDQ
ncbi:MAG: hypothetical protein RIS02_1688, partial [Pseudomonadota bacterium]